MKAIYPKIQMPGYVTLPGFAGIASHSGRTKLEFVAAIAYDQAHSKGEFKLVSSSLLKRVAAGEPTAFQDCLDCYGGLIWSLAKRLLPDQQEAEDAVQEVFLELWKKANFFDPNIASEKTFVAMLARRRLIDRLRKLYRQPSFEPIESSPAIQAEGLANSDHRIDANRALEVFKELKPDQQKCLRLSILTGLSHSEISDVVDLPIGTVKSHIRRGLISVREHLAARSANFRQGGLS